MSILTPITTRFDLQFDEMHLKTRQTTGPHVKHVIGK